MTKSRSGLKRKQISHQSVAEGHTPSPTSHEARPLHFPLLTAIVIVYFPRLCLRLPSSLSHSLLCDPV